MLWVVASIMVLGFGLAGLGAVLSNSRNMRVYDTAPIPLLVGLALIAAAVVLALGNAAVKALL